MSEPSEARERRVDVVGSKEREAEELAKMSRPAKAPARPTLPIRSKSRRGRLAMATAECRSMTAWRRGIEGRTELRIILLDGMARQEHTGLLGIFFACRGGQRWMRSPQRRNVLVLKRSEASTAVHADEARRRREGGGRREEEKCRIRSTLRTSANKSTGAY